MGYQAKRDDYDATDSYSEERKKKFERDSENNANTIDNAADVAIATGHPIAVAIGAGDKALNSITGGKFNQALGKGMAISNRVSPGGRSIQAASNKLAETGLGDTVGDVAGLVGGAKGGGGAAAEGAAKGGEAAAKGAEAASKGGEAAAKAAENAEKAQKAQEAADKTKKAAEEIAEQGKKADTAEKAQKVTDAANRVEQVGDTANSLKGGQNGSPSSDEQTDEEPEEQKGSGIGSLILKLPAVMMAITFAPFLIIILLIIMIIAMVTGIFDDYEDAFGMSSTLGEENGGILFNPTSEEQEAFYNRINNVKLEYQSRGMTLDAMKIVAIYHALTASDVDIQYEDVTESVIREWADAMFVNNAYSEETFRNNLTNDIFPSYKPGEKQVYYEEMTDEVFDYLERYYNLIGREMFGSSCASVGSCAYNIKGFYLPGRGNVLQSMQVSDLKVRLMECGSPYGNGNYNTPIDQDLVNFEDYIAGVAYAEVGPSAHEEVLKAQMVAARSFALSRPAAMNNSYGKKLTQENGQWILQISSCVADQVFCNIDLGCSYMGGGDGQGGICRSGIIPGASRTREALPQDHAIRRAAAETQGEVLVNAQGYIINTPYLSSDQNQWESLAQQGLNYKQILLQSYNSGSRNYGATDVEGAACNTNGSGSCISTGEFASWKQTDPQWSSTPMGNSSKTLGQIGCLVTSVSMLIAKSGVPVNIDPFNPGTFVEFLNSHGGFASGGNFMWGVATQAAPSFHYQGQISIAGMSQEAKLNKIKEIVSQPNVYAVVEVKGNTGQHWVAIDSVTGSTINMMDPSSDSTDMWGQYNWNNSSTIAYYKVG